MKWVFLLFSLFNLYGLNAQSLDKTTALNADDFYGVDDFENLYYGLNDVLYKKSKSGIQEFYDIQLGEITSVDLINPLKILVFYKDTQTVVFLDNRLNEQQRITFNQLQPQRFIEHVKLAGERRLWIYNLDLSRIELYDYINNRLITSSIPIKDKVSDLKTDYNFCHVITTKSIITINSYGSITNRINASINSAVGYDFKNLIFKDNTDWKWYRFDNTFRFRESVTTTTFPTQYIPESLYLKSGKLYIYHHKIVHIQTLNLNKS